MSLVVSQHSPAGRIGELALWGVAGLMMLSLHVGGAVYLMRETNEPAGDNSPPAAIMIELAAEPEAAKPEEEQISQDVQDSQRVQSEETPPLDTPPPEVPPEPVAEQTPEPVEPPPPEIAQPVEPPQEVAPPVEPPPQEVAETPPEPAPPEPVMPEPVMEEPLPEPEPQITQTIPETPPEPIEEPKPIEEQATALLENVEVPMLVMRPLPPPIVEKPPEPKKPQPKKEPVKKVVQKPKQPLAQARPEMAEAKIQAKQSERTAANQTSSGFIPQPVSQVEWMGRVRAKLGRLARACPGNERGIALVNFGFDSSGNVTNVSLARSSGSPKIDDFLVSLVRRASPIPAPTNAVRQLSLPLTCQ